MPWEAEKEVGNFSAVVCKTIILFLDIKATLKDKVIKAFVLIYISLTLNSSDNSLNFNKEKDQGISQEVLVEVLKKREFNIFMWK